MTKNERRAKAREEAERVRQEELKRAKRHRIIAIVAVFVVLAIVIGVVVAVVNSQKKSSPSAASSGSSSTTGTSPLGATTDLITQQIDHVGKDGGISVGKSLVAGSSNAGAPVVDTYFDVMCPFCTIVEQQDGEGLADMAKSGDITLVFHPLSLGMFANTPYSILGAQAEYFVAEHVPEKFVEFHNNLFTNVSNVNLEQTATATKPGVAEIVEQATKAGLTDSQVADLKSALESNSYKPYVDSIMKQMTKNGLKGTPTVYVNGTEIQTINQSQNSMVLSEVQRIVKGK